MTAAAAGPSADLPSLTAAHNARLPAIDSLLPAGAEPALATPPGPPPAYGTVAEELLTVPGAAGVARTVTVDPEVMESCWVSLRSHQLVRARVGGGDGPAAVSAMAALLSRWQAHVAAQPAGPEGETSAVLSWPSRDTVMTQLFLRRGLRPAVMVAARPGARPMAPAALPCGVTIRPLAECDVAAAGALQLAVVSWDAQFGGVHLRPSTPARSRDEVAAQLGAEPVTAWVAERAGAVVGYVAIEWPREAAWVSGLAAGDPGRTAYLGCMSVQAGRRGGGTGAALAAHVHSCLDAAGVQLTLLHHAALNPLSAPFWARCGYRPLWTGWEAVPHTAFR
ncbi:MAG: GNAT family N-acetyltransferase [Actinomycetota bacterium]